MLQPLINEDPSNLDLQRQQAYFYLRAGEPEKARAQLQDAARRRSERHALAVLPRRGAERSRAVRRGATRSIARCWRRRPTIRTCWPASAWRRSGRRSSTRRSKTFHTLLDVKDLPDNLQVLGEDAARVSSSCRGANYARGARDGAADPGLPRQAERAGDQHRARRAEEAEEYTEAVALLQPLVDKYSSDPFVNARYIEMLVARRRQGTRARGRGDAGEVRHPATPSRRPRPTCRSSDYRRGAIALAEGRAEGEAGGARSAVRARLGVRALRRQERTRRRSFLGILQKHPDHAPTLNYLGYMWAESGVNLDRAAEMLNKAVAAGAAQRRLHRLARLGLLPPGQARSRREVPDRRRRIFCRATPPCTSTSATCSPSAASTSRALTVYRAALNARAGGEGRGEAEVEDRRAREAADGEAARR